MRRIRGAERRALDMSTLARGTGRVPRGSRGCPPAIRAAGRSVRGAGEGGTCGPVKEVARGKLIRQGDAAADRGIGVYTLRYPPLPQPLDNYIGRGHDGHAGPGRSGQIVRPQLLPEGERQLAGELRLW
jgi:hypothetical protein